MLALLALSVLIAVAPEAPFGPLSSFTRVSALTHLATAVSCAAAVAAAMAACALALDRPIRRALRRGWIATVTGTVGGILVSAVLAAGAGLSVLDETVGLPEHPLLVVLFDLLPAALLAGLALIGAWLLLIGWLALRRSVLWPAAGRAATVAGGGYLTAAVAPLAGPFFFVAVVLAMVATLALAVWALRVATGP